MTYKLPVGYKRLDDRLLTTSLKRRTWWRNLRGGMPVVVRLQGKDIYAFAEAVEGDSVVKLGLRDFIGGNRKDGRMFGTKVEADGSLEPQSLKQAVMERVIVRTTLQ